MFAKSLIQSINELPLQSPISLQDSLGVSKVARNSLAEYGGIEVGDVLLSVNGQPASSVDITQSLIELDVITYNFYKPGSNLSLTITTSPVPLGIESYKTIDTVLSIYTRNHNKADHKDLYPVWNQGKHEALRQITLRAIKPWKMSLLRKLDFLPYSPEYLFYGAALYDMGEHEKGLDIVNTFGETHVETHTQEQDSVVKYYNARELLRQNRRDEAASLMLRAFSQWPHPRIQQEIYDLTGDYYEFKRHWPGRLFSCHYELEQVQYGSGSSSFDRTIAEMKDNQILLICMLGNYRVNRFYNAFMQRFLAYKLGFSDFIHDLHVISSDPDQENWDGYFVYERQYVDRVGPVRLLYDPDWEVWQYLEPHGSPTIYAVNKDRQVVYEGDLTDFDMWELVSGLEDSAQ